MIKRLLVASRGEIAVRIMATAAVLGIETVELPGTVAEPTSTSARPPAWAATCCTRGTASCPAALIDDGTRRRALPRRARKDCFVVPLVR